jgi:hypothetical protein
VVSGLAHAADPGGSRSEGFDARWQFCLALPAEDPFVAVLALVAPAHDDIAGDLELVATEKFFGVPVFVAAA